MESGTGSMSRTIPVRFLDRAVADPDRVAMRISDDSADPLTWRRWKELSFEFAAALRARTADTPAVAVLAGNTMVWPVSDL